MTVVEAIESGVPPKPIPKPDVPVFGIINAGPQAKIALLVPTNLNVDIRWAVGFQQILGQLPPGSTYMMDYRYGLGETREALVTEALVKIPDLTHIMFLDSDVITAVPNAVQLLLMDNKPIISGVYFNSLMTGAAAWKRIKDQNGQEVEAPIPVVNQAQQLVEVDKIGLGFAIIQKDVFTQLEEKKARRPWFYYTVDGGERKMQSEDFYFLDSVRETLGIKPWVDLRVGCGHIKTVIIMQDGSIQIPPHQGQQPQAGGQK